MTHPKETNRTLLFRFRDSDQKEPLQLRLIPLSRALQSDVVKVDVKHKSMRMRYQAGEEFLQMREVIQGGIVATMLDFTIAFVSMAVIGDDKVVATASLNVSYLKPAKTGGYFCDAVVERAGRTLVFVRASLIPEQGGDPVATATAVMAVSSAV